MTIHEDRDLAFFALIIKKFLTLVRKKGSSLDKALSENFFEKKTGNCS